METMNVSQAESTSTEQNHFDLSEKNKVNKMPWNA